MSPEPQQITLHGRRLAYRRAGGGTAAAPADRSDSVSAGQAG